MMEPWSISGDKRGVSDHIGFWALTYSERLRSLSRHLWDLRKKDAVDLFQLEWKLNVAMKYRPVIFPDMKDPANVNADWTGVIGKVIHQQKLNFLCEIDLVDCTHKLKKHQIEVSPEIWHCFTAPECSLSCHRVVIKCHDECTHFSTRDNEHFKNS
jgi:hypothetical protein